MGSIHGYARDVNESAKVPEASTICVRSHDPAWPLLCEGCGYVIEGLPRNNVCPECGRSIESSLPEARIGTIWQRADNPGWREASQTMRAMLWKPRATFDSALIDDHRSWDLLAWCAMDASLLSVLPVVSLWVSALLSRSAELMMGAIFFTTFFVVVGWVIQALIILLLCRVERIGMLFIGARHGWRIDRTASRVVCAHAAMGWLTGGVLVSLSFTVLITVLVTTFVMGLDDPRWLPSAFVVAYFGSWLLGLLHFESLVYLGMRRCRYANRPPPRSDVSPSPVTGAASS